MQAMVSSSRRHPRRLLLAVALVLAAATAFLAGGLRQPGTAGAATVTSCGKTITTSITLTNDLNCDGGIGIVVGKSAITINLGGHTIGGSGTVGIQALYAGVTISGGTIQGFDYGIVSGNSAKISKMVIASSSHAPIGVQLEPGGTLDSSRIFGFAKGVTIVNGSPATTTVKNSSFADNDFGIFAPVSATVTGNRVVGNGTGMVVSTNDASGTPLVSGNLVVGNQGVGIRVGGRGATVNSNVVNDNGYGADVSGAPFGIRADPGVIEDGKNTAKNNNGDVQCLYVACR